MPASDMDVIRERIMELVDEETGPDKMKPEVAIEFLEELVTVIEMRVETLREENDL